MIGIYAILGVTEHGWGSAQTLALGAVSVALLRGLRRPPGADRQPADAAAACSAPATSRAPTRSRRCSSPACSGCSSSARCTCSGSSATTRSRSASPSCRRRSLMGTMSLGFSEKLIMRFGPRTTLIPGVAMIGVGLLLFARTPVDGNYLTDLLPPMLLVGVGVGTSFPSLMTLAMSGATPEDSGLASGLVNTSVQVGGAIGLAVLATLAAERTDERARRRRRPPRGAQLRLPPRLPDRRRPGRRRAGRRGRRPAPALAGGDGGNGRRARTGRRRAGGARARGAGLRGRLAKKEREWDNRSFTSR